MLLIKLLVLLCLCETKIVCTYYGVEFCFKNRFHPIRNNLRDKLIDNIIEIAKAKFTRASWFTFLGGQHNIGSINRNKRRTIMFLKEGNIKPIGLEFYQDPFGRGQHQPLL